MTEVEKQRKRLGLTQTDMSKIMSVSKPTIVRWEKGTYNPKRKNDNSVKRDFYINDMCLILEKIKTPKKKLIKFLNEKVRKKI